MKIGPTHFTLDKRQMGTKFHCPKNIKNKFQIWKPEKTNSKKNLIQNNLNKQVWHEIKGYDGT